MALNGPRVVVIGAGWNGLSVAKTYLQIDPTIKLTILEGESTLGGTWSSARVYPELLTQGAYGQYEAVDFPLEQRDPDQPGGFIPSRRVHEYLEEYATRWNIADKIRYNATVERVHRAEDGIAWEIHIKDEDVPVICDKLIVATGLTSLPNMPEIPTSNFTPLTFHSRYLGQHHHELQSPDVHTVTIYGGGKSAYDAANAAMRAGKKVQWIIRTSGEGMALMLDPSMLKRSTTDAAWTPIISILQPDPLNLGWTYWFFHSGRNFIGYWLIWKFWDYVSRGILKKIDYDGNENLRKLKPKYIDRAMYWTIPAPFPVPEMELINRIKTGDGISIHQADIVQLIDRTIHLADGTTLETDILIHATGYAPQETIFSVKDAYKLGLSIPTSHLPDLESSPGTYAARCKQMDDKVLQLFPRLAQLPSKLNPPAFTQHRLYRSIVPIPLIEKNDRSLAFVGYLQGAGLSIIVDVSALWAVAWLNGEMDVRRRMEEVEDEVDYLNAFTRRRYGNRGAVTLVAFFEWISSTNAMLKDLGMPLPNVSQFKPWLPKVYRGLVEKWKKRRANGGLNKDIDSSRPGINYRLLTVGSLAVVWGVGLLYTRFIA